MSKYAKKVKAKKAEDVAGPDAEVTFTFNDVEYTVNRDLEVDVLLALEDERLATAVRGMLGPDQFRAYMESYKPEKPRVSDLAEFLRTATTTSTGSTPGE